MNLFEGDRGVYVPIYEENSANSFPHIEECYNCPEIGMIELKGMHLNHEFYVIVGKQCHTENA